MAPRTRIHFNSAALLAGEGEGASVTTFMAGQPVFRQGDPANAIHFLLKGKAKLSVVSDMGKEVVVALLNPNEFFGEGALTGQSSRISTAVCLTESVISRIETGTILQMIRDEPAFAGMFIDHLLARAIRAEADLIDQLFNSSEKRLARLLLLLAHHESNGGTGREIDNISQETLAQMIGTTRARVSFFMNKFRDLGFISYNGSITVHGSLLKAILQDQPQAQPADAGARKPLAGDQSSTVVPFRP